MDAHFIYTPRSGDRCLMVKPTEEVVIVTWPNMSRHAVGCLRQVEVESATQGRWFRRGAREVAQTFVELVGGVAYDDCGMITILVPVGWHVVAVDLVAAAEHTSPKTLIRAGREVVSEARMRGLSKRHPILQDDACRLARYKDQEPILVEGGLS